MISKDESCAYCMKDDNPSLYQAFGYYVCDLAVSTLYLFKEQSHPGRVIVAYKDHVSEMTELSPAERAAFIEDVNRVSLAIHKLFNPDKVNYGFYDDTGHHLHCHLCPKHKDQFEWGGVFLMNPKQKFATDEKMEDMAKKFRDELKK
ncbi:MAG: HIT family protein [Bacilli bacterium]|jgi:diadenosine tetraphosphate (Ap4A) HIT family hydrolase|nr:HIT family protein [Bacilli bacterium]